MLKKSAQVNSPNIVIQPTEGVVQKAVELLKKIDPNYFVGIKEIKINSGSSSYGFVESGKDKDPTVVNINLSKLKQSAGANEQELIAQVALTIAHECAHTKSYNEEGGFVGGENPAEAEERKVTTWIQNNYDKLNSLASKNYRLLKFARGITDSERSLINSEIFDVDGIDQLKQRLKESGYSLGERIRGKGVRGFYLKSDGEIIEDYFVGFSDYQTFRLEKFNTPIIKKKPTLKDWSWLRNDMTEYERWEKEQEEKDLI